MSYMPSANQKRMELFGRNPPVTIDIHPINGTKSITLQRFISYQFDSDITVPADSFSFSFVAPQDANSFMDYFSEGDIVELSAADKILCTGIIDQTEWEINEDGETCRVNGRDFMGQLEDNFAISFDSKPIYEKLKPDAVARWVVEGTRIEERGTTIRNAPDIEITFATSPSESRLSALLRYMEPLNLLAWMTPTGKLTLGRPNFSQPMMGRVVCSRKNRFSNCFSMKVTRSSTSIPNRIVVLYSNVQESQLGIPENQKVTNKAEGPSRLRQNGHNVIKTLMTSIPQGVDSSSFAAAAEFQVANSNAATLVSQLAQREFARANFNELLVQAVVPGHTNDNMLPYWPDQIYKVTCDRAEVDELMYLYAVQYNCTVERGQFTVLSFCRKNTIVAGSPAI